MATVQWQALEISEEFIRTHIDRWVAAWNSRDLKAVLGMYCDDVEFSSPKVKAVFPDRKVSAVAGKEELERYWSAALKKYEKLHFEPVSLVVSKNRCFFEYIGTYNSARQRVVEKFELHLTASCQGQVRSMAPSYDFLSATSAA